jgi:type II secretory pathway predicted ATPase ExeA
MGSVKMNVPHLNASTKAVLDLSDEDRIECILSPRWIGYTRATQILARLEALLVFPKRHRMPSLLIVGDTNNGKTMTVERFLDLHPECDNPEGDGIILPVLGVQAPPVPDEGRFYSGILEKLGAPYKPSDRADAKQFQIIRILSRLQTRMLIIDEIHSILAGPLTKQRNFLNTVKYLSNELQIPLVAVGTEDAFNALHTDRQLVNRFEPMRLPRWQMGGEYLKLLASFERMLPLKERSNLVETGLALKLLSLSDGTIGALSEVLALAAELAVKNGTERITPTLLDSVNWIPHSERKKAWGKGA